MNVLEGVVDEIAHPITLPFIVIGIENIIVLTISCTYFRKGMTLGEVVSVMILKILTERTGLFGPNNTGIFELKGDIFRKY